MTEETRETMLARAKLSDELLEWLKNKDIPPGEAMKLLCFTLGMFLGQTWKDDESLIGPLYEVTSEIWDYASLKQEMERKTN